MQTQNRPADDAVELLLTQHRRLESLWQGVLDEEDPAARNTLVAEAGDELVLHVSAEETVFYPAVRESRTEDILLESLEEHLSLKRLLADLLQLAPQDATFGAKCKVLQEQTAHHHREEEEHLFPKVLTLLGAERRLALGREMLQHQGALRRSGQPRNAVLSQTDAAEPLPD